MSTTLTPTTGVPQHTMTYTQPAQENWPNLQQFDEIHIIYGKQECTTRLRLPVLVQSPRSLSYLCPDTLSPHYV